MTMTFLRFVAASCAVGLLPATVQAQLEQPARPNEAAQPPDQQPRTQQPIPRSDQEETDQRVEARRIDPSASARQGAMTVQDLLVTKLMLANKGEIELSQLAIEKSENAQVKQFAQKMVQDHQQMNQQLQQLQSAGRSGRTEGQAESERPARTPNTRVQTEAGERPRLARDDQPGRPDAVGRAGDNVPRELTQVVQKTAENHLQMTKEKLQTLEGQDFDMGFLSIQVAGHTHMLAGLRAMQDVGSSEFQQLVKQAEQKTNEHLDEAKQLAKRLEDDRKAASRGSDPDAQPARPSETTPRRDSN